MQERQLTSVPELPDLVPLASENGFCEDNGSISFIVRNQGTGAAGPSTTTIDFGQH